MEFISANQEYTVNYTNDKNEIVAIKTNNKEVLKKYGVEDAKEIVINKLDNTVTAYDINTEESSLAYILSTSLSRRIVSLSDMFGGFNILFDECTPQIVEKRYKEKAGDEYTMKFYFVHDCYISDVARDIFNNKLKALCTDAIELVNVYYKNSHGVKYDYWKSYVKEEAKNTGFKITKMKNLKCIEIEYKIKIK